MIYRLIRNWIKDVVISSLNANIAAPNKMREVDVNVDNSLLPVSLKDKSYLIKFGDIQPVDYEVKMYSVNIAIQFQFLIAMKPIDNYQDCIDTYLFPLMDLLYDKIQLAYSNNAISTVLSLDDIDNIRLRNLDKAEDGGKFILPEITFELTFAKSN